MIDENKLKEKYDLSIKEYEAICNRVHNLLSFEEKSGAIIGRCNGNLNSTEKWLKKRLSTKEEVAHCVEFFENHGGYCNCEILFNVLPFVEAMEKDVTIDDD